MTFTACLAYLQNRTSDPLLHLDLVFHRFTNKCLLAGLAGDQLQRSIPDCSGKQRQPKAGRAHHSKPIESHRTAKPRPTLFTSAEAIAGES